MKLPDPPPLPPNLGIPEGAEVPELRVGLKPPNTGGLAVSPVVDEEIGLKPPNEGAEDAAAGASSLGAALLPLPRLRGRLVPGGADRFTVQYDPKPGSDVQTLVVFPYLDEAVYLVQLQVEAAFQKDD